ncbi:hypothetical protein AWZ03_009913 [Drosophila navojoa]|uniref:Bromodomain associated domain-containing protein n=1 Tax=Drosophila navojoa TaxID=7232 RepID=A0A484B6H9_DRONA|nr:uncharacterized protein LOC108656216 [Drosophila navojoa]XP_017963702.1 uncharacterized protein LOC108656216 [Drosophila navojoa]TDG43670.1 hypothetical protein AWZ03_009913 [Drosophila navojoa]
MQKEHWGAIEEECGTFALDKYVPTTAKKPKLDELRHRGDLMSTDKQDKIELKSSLVTQTIEVMKQTEVLQSLIDTYSNKNGTSNYLLNPCQMIPEVDFPPENAADLVSEQKFQKPIWFIPTVDTAFSRGDPQPYPEISTNTCRYTMRKVMCGLLRLAGFTDCSESAVILLTDAAEEFMRSFITEYRGFYDIDDKLERSTMLQLLPLEQAYFSMTGTSLTQVHNYYKHKVISRNRVEISEFTSVLHEYDKLMKESQSSMQKQQQHLQQQQHNQHDFNGHDFLNILEMQPGEDGGSSATGSNSMGNIVGEMLQELGGSTNSSISLSNVSSGQQQMLNSNALYGLLDGQMSNNSNTMASTTNYQNNFDT